MPCAAWCARRNYSRSIVPLSKTGPSCKSARQLIPIRWHRHLERVGDAAQHREVMGDRDQLGQPLRVVLAVLSKKSFAPLFNVLVTFDICLTVRQRSRGKMSDREETPAGRDWRPLCGPAPVAGAAPAAT